MQELPLLQPLCCGPGTPTMDATSAEQLAATFKALADPTRVSIINRLAGGEACCVCDLTDVFELSQPTVSHHLKKLTDAGLLEREQRGKWAYFSLRPEAVETLAAVADLKGAWS